MRWPRSLGGSHFKAVKEASMATIRSLLSEHVTLQVRSVDRILLHAWVPKLMSAGGVIGFLRDRGFPIPSLARLAEGRLGRPSPLRVRPPGGCAQPLLLLSARSRLGAFLLEELRLCPLR